MPRQFGPCGEIVVQGGSSSVVNDIVYDSVASGSSGVLFSITPPSGQRLIITGLAAQGADETNIQLSRGGVTLYSGILRENANSSSLSLYNGGYIGSSTNEYQGVGVIAQIDCGVDETFEVEKTSGTTGATIYLAYKVVE